MEQLNILVLDDELVFRELLGDYFTESGHTIFTAERPSQAFAILDEENIDVALVDIYLPEMNGIEVIQRIKERYTGVETVAITGNADINTVVDAMRVGAVDFISKPFSLDDIQASVERTRNHSIMKSRLQADEVNYHKISSELKKTLGVEIVGVSPAMKRVMNLAAQVAATESTSVLITGESGTGKELIARSIHAMSSRRGNFFHSVNCSAIPETLFESEFFGHKKGSFTGAVENTAGWFEISHHGTLFLDEVAELPLTVQAKFLRVLDDKIISKIGAKKEISLDLRIVAATNQDLEKMVSEKRFRIDLFHRLNSFLIHIPPLRERREDIPELINYYVEYFAEKLGKRIKKVDERLHSKLYEYDFPGNVRELRNIIESAMIVCDDDSLRLKHICKGNGNSRHLKENGNQQQEYDLDKIERETVLRALNYSKFNKSKAARLLNISRQALDRKMEKFDIKEESRYLF